MPKATPMDKKDAVYMITLAYLPFLAMVKGMGLKVQEDFSLHNLNNTFWNPRVTLPDQSLMYIFSVYKGKLYITRVDPYSDFKNRVEFSTIGQAVDDLVKESAWLSAMDPDNGYRIDEEGKVME